MSFFPAYLPSRLAEILKEICHYCMQPADLLGRHSRIVPQLHIKAGLGARAHCHTAVHSLGTQQQQRAHARRTVILSAHLGLQGPSMLSHSAMGGSFLGKQLQRGSLIRSQPKMVGSSLYLRPAPNPPGEASHFFLSSFRAT